jgi:hypothetical protein
VANRPRNVLVLSGGGANGAYTAGLLTGWTAAGTRPCFDVVTGISAGALIAPFAFLGPEYDNTLIQGATGPHATDVYERRLPPALFWSDALADSAPLRRRIEAEITPEVLTQIARAHEAGRRLYVGTTDLDTKRLVVWDLGAIAAGNDPGKLELVRTVLLAAASVPGMLPPVPINVQVNGKWYTELHVDGGVNASLFLHPRMVGLTPERPQPAPERDLTIYVLAARKLQLPTRPVEPRLVPVAGESIDAILQSRFEKDLLCVYLLSRFAGGRFALAAIPESFPDTNSLTFDAHVMHELYDWGHRAGAEGFDWRSFPPGLSPSAKEAPRSGVVFTIEEVRRGPRAAARAESGSPVPDSALQTLFDRVRQDIGSATHP